MGNNKNIFEQIKDFFSNIALIISKRIDEILSNVRNIKYASFIIAVVLFVVIGMSTGINGLFDIKYQTGIILSDIPVKVQVDYDKYEISGIPETVDANIVGDRAEVQDIALKRSIQVGIDLSNLKAGEHQVKLVAVGATSNTRVSLTPSTVYVTLKEKRNANYTFDPIFVNKNDNLSYGEPEFEVNEVQIRASDDAHEKIKYVKAIIDVKDQISDVSLDAKLVAYDGSGNAIAVEIIPATVKAKVKIKQSQKEVPIKPRALGQLPNKEFAIDSIEMSDSVTTIFGSPEVLKYYTAIEIPIPLGQITEESKLELPIIVGKGITNSTVSKVDVTIKLGKRTEKEVSDIPIGFKNLNADYKVEFVKDEDKYTKVLLSGTEKQLDAFVAERLVVYADLTDLNVGEHTVELLTESNLLVDYELEKTSIKIRISK